MKRGYPVIQHYEHLPCESFTKLQQILPFMHFELTQQQARVKTKTWPVKPNHSVETNRRNVELEMVKEKVKVR